MERWFPIGKTNANYTRNNRRFYETPFDREQRSDQQVSSILIFHGVICSAKPPWELENCRRKVQKARVESDR